MPKTENRLHRNTFNKTNEIYRDKDKVVPLDGRVGGFSDKTSWKGFSGWTSIQEKNKNYTNVHRTEKGQAVISNVSEGRKVCI